MKKFYFALLYIALAVCAVASTTLTWEPTGAARYDIYRDGALIGSTTTPSYVDPSDGDHQYRVEAVSTVPVRVESSQPNVDPWASSWRTGGNDTVVPDELRLPLTLRWTNTLNWPVENITLRKRLLAAGGKVIATKDLYYSVPVAAALDSETGKTLWLATPTSLALLSNFGIQTIANGKLWHGLPHELGFAFDVQTGERKALEWGQSAATSIYSVSNASGIYGYGLGGINSPNNPQVSALNLDGKVRWTKAFKGLISSTWSYYAGGTLPVSVLLGQPAIGKYLYVPMGKLQAFDLQTGEIRWTQGNWPAQLADGDSIFWGVATIRDGILYAIGQTWFNATWGIPQLYAYSTSTHIELWHLPLPTYPNYERGIQKVLSLPVDALSYAVHAGVVYARSSDTLTAIRVSTGEPFWTVKFPEPYYIKPGYTQYPLTGPVIVSNNSIFILHNKSIQAFNPDTGAKTWEWNNPANQMLSWMIVAYGKLVAIDAAGTVYAF